MIQSFIHKVMTMFRKAQVIVYLITQSRNNILTQSGNYIIA